MAELKGRTEEIKIMAIEYSLSEKCIAYLEEWRRTSKGKGIKMKTEEVLKLEMRTPLYLLWKSEPNYMAQLTREIEKHGITEPITIRVREDGSMIVWDGLHRLAVAEKLGIKEIPVIYI